MSAEQMPETPLEEMGIGNLLNGVVVRSRGEAFNQSELAQLSHSAFDFVAGAIRNGEQEEIEISYPIGYTADRKPILSEPYRYQKLHLVERYEELAYRQIPKNGIYQLATIVEALLSDLIRCLIVRYPKKLDSRRQVLMRDVLEAESLVELRLLAADKFLNELAYKSPKDFASSASEVLSLNLLECPAFHRYIEMKATRDVLIHNRGVANEAYESKSGSHARVKAGQALPIDQSYFLEVYESCLQLFEWLEAALHEKWHSREYESRRRVPEEG